jgi:CubicO group peptidase (beta-lactamase class C family)
MANSMRIQTKPERVRFSAARKIVLSILSLVVIWAACLFAGNFFAIHAGYGNLGELLRGERYDKRMPPVAVGDLPAVLDKDIAEALKIGALAPGTGAGVSIGVVEHGATRVFSYGTAMPDSMYEIGSITKTFTGLVLAQMVEQRKVRFDEPVRELLPAGSVVKPDGAEITLVSLATQHSGLPRMPDNFHPADRANPFADYQAADLYAYLAKHGVGMPVQTDHLYSNLGFGLLGFALSNRAGLAYPVLLQEEVTGPMGLKDTVVALSPGQRARLIQGHDSEHHPARNFDDSDVFAGAGAILSSAPDMLLYLEANLHPESLHPTDSPAAAATLPAVLKESHQLRADGPGGQMALAWLFQPGTGDYSHDGSAGGYTSFAVFNPKGDFAVVVLSNTGPALRTPSRSFADRLAQHIKQRLAGERAISLAN